jgi:head-tail adaptor
MREFSGALNVRLSFEHAIDRLNPEGVTTRIWEPFVTLWAALDTEHAHTRPNAVRLERDGVVRPEMLQVTLRRCALPNILRFVWDNRLWQVAARNHPRSQPDRMVLYAFDEGQQTQTPTA